jgi:deferrochelatase/peroxidase EfeB
VTAHHILDTHEMVSTDGWRRAVSGDVAVVAAGGTISPVVGDGKLRYGSSDGGQDSLPERGEDQLDNSRPRRVNRRTFLGSMSTTAAGAVVGVTATRSVSDGVAAAGRPLRNDTEPFYGVHQGGIATEPQSHSMFVAFDVITDQREELKELLRVWTSLAAKLTLGRSGPSFSDVAGGAQQDSGSTVGLGPARLTVNFGFGPSLFGLGGTDRFGLSANRPVALIDLPEFPGDQLTAATTGGDLSVHACADDPQVTFHAAQQLVRAARGVAVARWSQAGFNEGRATAGTPRNLMGFKDGTTNPATEVALDDLVWVSGAGPNWMVGGTYLVARRIRIALDEWDDTPVAEQERIIGRHKVSGAPLGRSAEFDALDLVAKDTSGHPVVPLDAHVRIASPQENWNNAMLRRSYAFSDGLDTSAESSGPASPAIAAGLFFMAYQSNPRLSFIPIYGELARTDSLQRFTTHTASMVVAIPPAAPSPGHWIGEQLFGSVRG